MTQETVPANRRIYQVFSAGEDGRVRMKLSLVPPAVDEALAVIIARGELMAPHPIEVDLLTSVAPAADVFGGVDVTQTAAVAISAGIRTLTLSVAGVRVGDAVLVLPTGPVPTGYLIGQASVVANDFVRLAVQAPALAIGAKFSIACRVVRLNI